MDTTKGWFVRVSASRFVADYGMALVLLLLCLFFSIVTIDTQHPTGADAGRQLAAGLMRQFGSNTNVLLVAGSGGEDATFVKELAERLDQSGVTVIGSVNGTPADVRQALERMSAEATRLDAIACSNTAARWKVLDDLDKRFPSLAGTLLVKPRSYLFPRFLKPRNLANVAGQSAVFAIIAIGMTMVIITAGIDLSVGSLVALSAVTSTLIMREVFGGFEAGPWGMVVASMTAIAVCALVGLFSGVMITAFGIPPFIVTLAMMSIGRGLAQILADGQSVYQIPSSFRQFAGGRLFGLPNSVMIMILLYLLAHICMTRTIVGRYIYAVGGNREAARLSGVPVGRVLILVYALCGALAGLGGVIQTSRLGSGSPLYGSMYELFVIAAVVVGGTSLAGGEGKVLSTLIGALIIAVIGNGMNLMNIKSHPQGVIMGVLILLAVLIDMFKKRGWRFAAPG